MADAITGETNKDRAKLAREAGIGKLSLLAILAGAVTAFGTFAILLAIISAIAGAVGADTDFGTLDWRDVGIGAGITIALALLVAYLFGGYVAGRMARRAGWLNGLAVFVLAILVPAVLAAILSSQADDGANLGPFVTRGRDADAAQVPSAVDPALGSTWSACELRMVARMAGTRMASCRTW